jgi:ABC-type amino acid transport substrate-binding protein
VPEDKRELVDNYVAVSRYTTLEDLAQAVYDGQVDADDDARAVLEQVWRIAARKRLTVVPDTPGDGE